MKRLILGGGGHSHLEVVRRLGQRPAVDCEVVLVDPAQFATYSGMLPGLIAGHYRFDDCHVDLARLAQRAGVRFLLRRIVSIDAARREISLDDDSRLAYDVLSLDVGSTPPAAETPGAAQHALAVKPFRTFAERWERLTDAAPAGQVRTITVVGGGAAGVELVLAMQWRLAQAAPDKSIAFTLITADASVVPDHNAGTRAALERILHARGVALHRNTKVERVASDAVILGRRGAHPSDATIWATGASAPAWFSNTGLALDARGFLSVDEGLASISHPGIFAAGDCSTIAGYRYPKSGVYAVRQGPVLAENLRRALIGEPLLAYRPQQTALALISAGDRYAIGSYGRFSIEGAWVWRWKDYIDRRFVRRYRS